MIQNVTAYLIETFSLHPKYDEIHQVCAAAIELFPAYKTQPSAVGGIVSSYFMLRKINFSLIIDLILGRTLQQRSSNRWCLSSFGLSSTQVRTMWKCSRFI